jgi:hypothetical protein
MSAPSKRLLNAVPTSRNQAVAIFDQVAKLFPNTKGNWHDSWENSTAITGIRTIRLRVHEITGGQPVLDRTMAQAREILGQLPKGSWIIRTWQAVTAPMQGTDVYPLVRNVITIYYKSQPYRKSATYRKDWVYSKS